MKITKMAASVLKAAGLIIFRQAKRDFPIEYLLLQTSYGIHHWTPPKGHVDPGENEMEAAIRETLEEAGITSNDYDILDSFINISEYIAHGRQKRVTYWLAKVKKNEIEVRLSNEHKAFEWLELGKACERVKFDDMQRVLKEAELFIKDRENQNI